MTAPNDEEPPMNKAIEDCLAMSGYDTASRELTLRAWLMLGAEYMAREVGRAKATKHMNDLAEFVRTARPSKPWRK